jgi:adenylosuccinate synthase
MSTAIAIIGANYGDEAKGNAVAYFTRKLGGDPLVVRGNGGAQAGHTVVTENGQRHVFGHLGAGTLDGARTYLASNFIVNPLVFAKEYQKLCDMGASPQVFASPACMVSTIYDMALNSLAELARGNERHGSCGMGINETVTRDQAGFRLDLQTLYGDREELLSTLGRIRKHWVPMRLDRLGLTLDSFRGASSGVMLRAAIYYGVLLADPELVLQELQRHATELHVQDPKKLTPFDDPIIIEGAQGLALDEFLGEYPHVTRSITGLPSAIRAAYECGKRSVRPVYVTRAYLTRHGAGPLPGEGTEITDHPLSDLTNVQNEWQGTLRYAPLNIRRMVNLIKRDRERGELVAQALGIMVEKPELFVSCLDQLGTAVRVCVDHDHYQMIPSGELLDFISYLLPTDMRVGYASYGPTPGDVRELP